MSLQVWLPLNGNLKNQGLSGELTVIGTPTYANGKIGKGLSGGGCTMPAAISKNILNNNALSICCWIYPNADTGANSGILFGTDSMGENNNRKFSIFLYPTINDLHLSWQNDTANSTFFSSTDHGLFPSYTWTHLAVIYNNPNVYIYINGVLKKTYTNCVSNSSSFEYNTPVIHNNSTRIINDFRIYNHALSTKEVKEISKGLILYYPLCGSEGGVNLLKGTATRIATSSGVTSSGSLVYDSSLVPLNSLIGKTFVFSFDYSIEGAKANATGNWQNDRFGAHLALTYKDASGTTSTAYPAAGYLEHSGTGRAVQTYKCDPTWTEITDLSVSVQAYNKPASNNTNTWYLKNFKLELGNADTGYSINPNTLGITPNEIVDCSGYNNNGKINGFVVSDKNTARHNNATGIADINNISMPDLAFENIDNGSLSFWIKFNNFNKWSHYVFIANSFNWTGKSSDFIIVANQNNLSASTSTAYLCLDCCSYTSSHSVTTEYWYHIVITWDAINYVIKKYINGVLAQTIDDTANKRLDTYRAKHNTRGLGNVYKSANYSGDFVISDFRIYATTLTADDVKELYQIPISIDKSGNAFAMDFIEDQSPEFYKNGIIENSYIHENEADDSDTLKTFHIGKIKTFANQILEV